MLQQGLLVLGGAALVALLAIVLRAPCERLRLVDHPNQRKQHGEVVPLSGGVAVALVIMGLVSWLVTDGILLRALESAVFLLVIGFIDDRYSLSAGTRLFFQTLAASWVVLAGGLVVTDLGLLGRLDAMAVPFTVVAVVALLNACNMIDGSDGVFGSALFPVCIGIALVADGALSTLALIIAGSLLGFLVVNWPSTPGTRRARWRTFIGNGGVEFVGLLVAAMLIVATQHEDVLKPGSVPLLVIVPLAELSSTVLRRLLAGGGLMTADARHTHHRLLAAGYLRGTLPWIYGGVSTLFVAVAIGLSEWLPDAAWLRWTLAFSVLTAAVLAGVKWRGGCADGAAGTGGVDKLGA